MVAEQLTQKSEQPPPEYSNGTTSTYIHSLHLENKGRKWLKLHVQTQKKSPLPVFHEVQSITGTVEVDLEKAETVKGITIEVQAGTTAVGQEEERFLEVVQTIWVPPNSSSKLSGRQSWPFKVDLPLEVQVPKGKGKSYKLPPNFTEKASPAYIDYRLVVTVKRGAFKANQTLSTNFAYLPLTVPGPLSELRQTAYKEKVPLLGPDADPQGWKILPVVVLVGTIFDAQKIKVECTLAVATPVSALHSLSYAPGSPLPLYLTLKSDNTQALDLLAVPEAIRLFLTRYIAIGSDAHQNASAGRSSNRFGSGMGQAAFWASGEQTSNKREMQGELEVSTGLKPSFVFPRFTVRYFLEFLAFSATGFRPSIPQTQTLLTEEVAVTTQQTPGVVPWSNIPPGYTRPEVVDYNSAVGYLENGNQRFYGHGHLN